MDLLAVDLGNSGAKLGLFRDDDLVDVALAGLGKAQPGLPASFADLVAHLAPPVVLASVNPSARVGLEGALRKLGAGPILRLRRDLTVQMPCLCDKPQDVGDDRLANAVAAWRLAGGAAIVVDAGTALAFDVVSSEGEFLGGAIAPGLGMSARALHEFTALLPLVEPHEPDAAIGRDTVQAINTGLVIGLAGLVDRLVEAIRAELGSPATVIATGGHALLAPYVRSIDRLEQHLTLLGLKFIYDAQSR